jgi:hypothetical protein
LDVPSEELMKMRMVLSGLSAGAVIMVAGAAFSSGTATNTAQLVSFDQRTSTLWAYPTGRPLASYLNQHLTEYIAADLRLFVPPDPCIPVVDAWNFTVEYDRRFHVKSTFVFELLLGVMSDLACKASVTSVTSGSPEPLISITPIN